METFEKIYQIVVKIPKGKVLTYKKIADYLKINPRIVGYALHANKNPEKIPCHRVVKANGLVAKGYKFGGKLSQIKKLKDEGVEFLNSDIVNLKISLYNY